LQSLQSLSISQPEIPSLSAKLQREVIKVQMSMLISDDESFDSDDESFDNLDSLCLPSENEEMPCDSDDESAIDLFKTSPINEMILVSEAPF
jgi:hypothetical protein